MTKSQVSGADTAGFDLSLRVSLDEGPAPAPADGGAPVRFGHLRRQLRARDLIRALDLSPAGTLAFKPAPRLSVNVIDAIDEAVVWARVLDRQIEIAALVKSKTFTTALLDAASDGRVPSALIDEHAAACVAAATCRELLRLARLGLHISPVNQPLADFVTDLALKLMARTGPGFRLLANRPMGGGATLPWLEAELADIQLTLDALTQPGMSRVEASGLDEYGLGDSPADDFQRTLIARLSSHPPLPRSAASSLDGHTDPDTVALARESTLARHVGTGAEVAAALGNLPAPRARNLDASHDPFTEGDWSGRSV